MEDNRYRKLGTENLKALSLYFDSIYDKYKEKALLSGLSGKLKFIKEKGKVIIYALIKN